MTTTAQARIYLAAKAATGSTAKATRALIDAGVDFDAACDLSWQIETGKAEPQWLYEDGTETQASRDFDAARDHEEE